MTIISHDWIKKQAERAAWRVERHHLQAALKANGWNLRVTAKSLGVRPRTLSKALRRFPDLKRSLAPRNSPKPLTRHLMAPEHPSESTRLPKSLSTDRTGYRTGPGVQSLLLASQAALPQQQTQIGKKDTPTKEQLEE